MTRDRPMVTLARFSARATRGERVRVSLAPLDWLVLALVGLLAGGFGVVVGAGGGFIIAPLLLLMFHLSPAMAAGTSLVIVWLNALSGTLAYARQQWVDYRAGLTLALPAAPGALLGAAAAQYVSPTSFRALLGVLLLVFAVYLIARPEPAPRVAGDTVGRGFGLPALGVGLGFISSFFGMGAGWLVVPLLVHLYRFPAHVAVATSIFSLFVYSMVGMTVHVWQGHVLWPVVVAAGLGVIVAGQVGTRLSTSVKGVTRIRLLAAAMAAVGVGLLVR